MPKNLVLENVSKVFLRLHAVKNIDLKIKEGEFVTLLGPSGCGKTTMLRMIAGFETPTSGKIFYDNKVINDLIPQKRNFGDELLHMVGLMEHKEKYLPELSGGMQQRVALARALAPSPEVILLDEPLSALDAKIRVKLRAEIKQLQIDLGITTIYVTHDQEEALSISDRVVIMNRGEIEQIDKPINIYKNPESKYVVNFVGTSNFFEGELKNNVIHGQDFELKVSQANGIKSDPVSGAIRPEKIEIVMNQETEDLVPQNILTGKLIVVVFLGLMVRLLVRVGDRDIIVDFLKKRYEQLGINRRDNLRLYLPPGAFRVYKS